MGDWSSLFKGFECEKLAGLGWWEPPLFGCCSWHGFWSPLPPLSAGGGRSLAYQLLERGEQEEAGEAVLGMNSWKKAEGEQWGCARGEEAGAEKASMLL